MSLYPIYESPTMKKYSTLISSRQISKRTPSSVSQENVTDRTAYTSADIYLDIIAQGFPEDYESGSSIVEDRVTSEIHL